MQHALDLAWRGWGRVHPNPLVGAVVLDGGEAVGEGWHAEYGEQHAEPIALAAAGPRARGATLVVTLEPCAHQGKQPPCVDAILRAGIRRVVAALPDANPVAAGGAAALRAAGVSVELGLERSAAEAQNAAFLHGLGNPERPFVALKLATSLDGRIADLEGRSRWISGSDARGYVHWLRAGFDAEPPQDLLLNHGYLNRSVGRRSETCGRVPRAINRTAGEPGGGRPPWGTGRSGRAPGTS